MDRLRLLSYNIQAGIASVRFRDYIANSWKHLLPHRARMNNLNRISEMIGGYDVVGLQEVDAGSLRSAFIDQTEFLARVAGYPHWHRQINRDLGSLAQHSNGLLSRLQPKTIRDHKLPGLPGRGVLLGEFQTTSGELLAVCVAHLALGARARRRQFDFLAELTGQYPYAVLMGDFNSGCGSSALRAMVERGGWHGLDCERKTFPSWRPQHNLDHILVSTNIEILGARVVDYALSDHLPISMEIRLPSRIEPCEPIPQQLPEFAA
ncbi:MULTISPECIES: endonuclease/exonuclease/phosphatase family protein [Thiorhodovibrio]|jgi:endonuclease/exonuclease/phosphatase family metal-dependent hydrolase|uniref:endonuclease/exonuclease/phosphatase family protein n=1 Tax=Thiorhodovibrio TaxID=61593 RepID=UPI0019124D41|nr:MULTISPECIES: endonuclease/exonuclease/phosphatase family protein [Thiorhodovibrio]MBK5968982.1 endonuclease [Thiorhodovibrio winogradskyi]WPL10302.1 Endonuclease/Exonuclease/phosphatase family protein [Thiorhodovibrio litoralis]